MFRTAILATAATCVVGVRRSRGSDSLVDGLDMEEVSEGLRTEKWCSLEEHTLSCDEGAVIEIEKAQYNRQRNSECRPAIDDPTAGEDCEVTVTETLAADCDTKQECKVPVSFHSSACPKNPFSYLRVRFECVGGAAQKEKRPAPPVVTTTVPPEAVATTTEKVVVLPAEVVAPTTTKEKLFVLPSQQVAATTIKPTPAPPPRFSKFTVWVKTSDEWWSGTDDTIYVKLTGEGGDLGWHKLDYFFQNDFERSSLQAYKVQGVTPIAATTVCLKKEKAGFVNDAWLPGFVKVFEDEAGDGSPAQMIGWADGWDWFQDETPVCKPLKT